MDTLLITTQIVCYGVGIVSASLNVAVLRRHARLRRRLARALLPPWSVRRPD